MSRGIGSITQTSNAVLRSRGYDFNGNVNAAVFHENTNTLFVGGDFTSVREYSKYDFSTTVLTGDGIPAVNGDLYTNGTVFAVAPDQSGGYYLGGSFTSVNGEARNCIAHINRFGLLSPWNPNANGTVRALAVSGDNVYVGGDFTSVASTTRDRLAAVNTAGSLLSWDPNANGTVRALAVSGDNVYVGGDFSSVAGTTRNRLAAVNTAGSLLAWDPGTGGPPGNREVYALAVSGDNIYVGGAFASVASTTRSTLAAVNTAGSLLSWNPSPSGSGLFAVKTIAVSGTNIYIGGTFTTVGSVPRSYAALINSSGSLLDWDPSLSGAVSSISPNLPNIYVGGDFTSAGSQGSGFIIFDQGSYLRSTSGRVVTNGIVWASTPDGLGGAYIGGTFTTVNGQTRNRLAHVNSSGQVTSWNPSADNTVRALLLHNSVVYIGGVFTSVAGTVRNRLAAVNTASSLATWNPSASSDVYALARISENIYIGGAFGLIASTTRNRLASVNTSGSLLAWNPSASSAITALTPVGDNIYIGGNFFNIVATARNYLAAVNTAGSLLAWNPSANNFVHAVHVLGDNIYIGGAFSAVSSQNRARVASVTTGGSLLSWDPSANSNVNAIGSFGTNIYLAGNFSTISNDTTPLIAITDVSGSLVWKSTGPQDELLSTSGAGYAISVVSGFAYFGGDFSTIFAKSASKIVRSNSSGYVQSFSANVQSNVNSAVSFGSNVYIGGLPGSIAITQASHARNRLAAFSASTGSLTNWNPNANGSVQSMAIIGDNVYVGGNFTSVSSTTRNYLSSVNTSGSLQSWNPSASGQVLQIRASDENIYAVGEFTSVASTTRNRAAVVNTSGSLSSFSVPVNNGSIRSVAVSGSDIYLSGDFSVFEPSGPFLAALNSSTGQSFLGQSLSTGGVIYCATPDGLGGFYLGGNFNTVNGVSRFYLAQVNSSGQVTSWNPNCNSAVESMIKIGDNLYFGGFFNQVSGTNRWYLAAVNTSGSLLSWNPSASYFASTLVNIGTNIYIGGSFTAVAGTTRKYAAAVNTAGSLLAWNPNFYDESSTNVGTTETEARCLAMVVSGSDIYCGGLFRWVGGKTTVRGRLAAFNQSGTLLSWNPNVESGSEGRSVRSMSISGNNIYFCGSFTQVSGTTRDQLAAVNTSGSLLAWSPAINNLGSGTVYADGSTIHIGSSNIGTSGYFVTNSAGSTVSTLISEGGAVSPAGGRAQYVIFAQGENVILSGNFTQAGGAVRNRGALVNSSGALQSWTPNANASITEMQIIGDNIYMSGSFTSMGGQARNYLGAVNTSGSLVSWNPSANSSVTELIVNGENIYVSGGFSSIDSQLRDRFAVINTLGSVVGSSIADPSRNISNQPIRAIAQSSSSIFVLSNQPVNAQAARSPVGLVIKKSDNTQVS